MKVAFLTYPSAFQNVGGGEILLLKLKEYLEKQNIKVDLFDMWKSRVEQFDLLHVFGSVKDCLGLVRVANTRKIPVVITPILWSDWRRALFTDDPLTDRLDLMVRHAVKMIFPAFPSQRRELLLRSNLIFPNSEIEKKHISRLFAVPERKMRVVYNGVDTVFQNADSSVFKKTYGADPFILGVGRIEPRKNQLNLIKAVKDISGARLILIGSPVSGYEDYFERCRRMGSGFTTFIPTLKHDDPLLRSAYAACGLFVLQGWFETPGLAALEAALAGAKVLATSGGSTREYFENYVDYFDPGNPNDMRLKILSAMNRHRDFEAFRCHILNHFTWERIAEETLRYYREVLKR